jgi:chromosome segregation ATPase
MDRKYQEEIKWLQKQHKHLSVEFESKKRRAQEAEEELTLLREQKEAMQPAMDQLKAENEELKSRLEKRAGARVEMERMQVELEAAQKSAAEA